MKANNHLGEFLRARRTQLSPDTVGLRADGRRHLVSVSVPVPVPDSAAAVLVSDSAAAASSVLWPI